MNIIFENGRAEKEIRNPGAPNNRSNTNRVTTSHSDSQPKKIGSAGVFALDISGTVMDNTAYEGQGKTAEDVMQDAGQVDIATQKNYMAVMSNTMSDEDFAKLQKDGYHPGSTKIETVVTIVDEIKAALVKGGKNIMGYTDDLDVETLTEITGSSTLAQEIVKQFGEHDIPVTKENVEDVLKACDTVMQLDSLSDGVMKYMIQNRKEPSIDNIYRAKYSAAADADKQGRGYYQDDTGYYAKKADSYNWEQLNPQMEKVIENAGLTVSGETLADARWLIEKGIPLTEDALQSLYELKNLEIPDTTEKIVSLTAAAIASGKKAGAANMADERSDLKKALNYMEDVNHISDEAVDMIAGKGEKLNLRNLKAAQLQISLNIRAEAYTVSRNGRRLMEEVRLQMTVESNLRLIRSGFSVDTAELEQLVEALKAAEQQTEEALFGTAGAKEVFKNTLATVRELGNMPAALVGRFAFSGRVQITASAVQGSDGTFTLKAAYEQGSILKSAYEKAGETYEALMTSPRADLGDSIKKAFRNVDDLLRNMKMETSEANRRAVRILGYNRMEISEENISAVKTTDLSIRRVLDKMTPASTLQMIRDGVNPLSVNMEELETYLDNREKDPGQDMEKYSTYLYKLEKNHQVSEQEREAYIGIYRLFRQLEKTDGAAIGTLLDQGAELTVRNLLSAMRSNKKAGMDVAVDDRFGGVTGTYQTKSISEQIEAGYYRRLASDIYDNLDGGKMDLVSANGEMTLEQLAEALRTETEDENANREFTGQQAGEMRKAMLTEDFVVRELLEFHQPVTADNLVAAGLLMKERGKAAGRMYELAEETGDRKAVEEAAENLLDKMTDETSAREAYKELEQVYGQVLENAVYGEQTGKIDMKEISSLYKQISLSGHMAKEESYEVPVKIGEEITSINLKIIHDQKESGRVTASMETTLYGKVTAQFHIVVNDLKEYGLSGYIACDSKTGLQILKQTEDGLKKSLEQSDIKIVSLHFVYHEKLDLTAATGTAGAEKEEAAGEVKQEISTKKLYDTAKIFIGYIQKGEGLEYENLL